MNASTLTALRPSGLRLRRLRASRACITVAIGLLLALSQGCASYYSHFAVFPAANSEGEPRQVRLSWQTAEYPDWWFGANQATSVKLETQCSERTWRLRDSDDDLAGACGSGIRACAEPGRDLVARTGQPAPADFRCMAINPRDSGARIAEVGEKLELLVSCLPAVVAEGQGEDALNLDYIRASSVPYTVYVRKAPRGSLRARPPEFDESVCDAE